LRIEGSPNINTKDAAEKAERDRIDREEEAIRNPQKEVPPIFAKFAETFTTTYAKTNNKISERTAKRSILTHHLLPALGSKRLDKITGEDVENLKASLIEKGKSPKRVNNILVVLSKILRYADEIDLIERAPKIKALKVAPKKLGFFTFEEFDRLVAGSAEEPQWHAAVLLAGEAGLRMGEILALEWEDIDLKTGTLTVMRNDWRGQIGSPKSGKDRPIPLTKRTVVALKAIRHLRGRLVFCWETGARWTLTTMRAGIKRQEKRAGLRVTGWHVLRHTFCSHLAMRGAPAVSIKELAGHSSITVTNRYMHENGELRSAIDRLELRTGYGQK
jgi:integrase